jgi:hypothetical protein
MCPGFLLWRQLVKLRAIP